MQSALSALALVHNDQNRMLFAAVSEAMKYGTKRQGAQLLQRILDKYHNTPSPEVATPLLLRCTASLLLLALAEEDHDSDELLSRLCAIFKAAAILSQNLPSRDSSSTGLSFRECRWFEVTSFRAAVEHINTWPNKYIIDLLCHSCQVQFKQSPCCPLLKHCRYDIRMIAREGSGVRKRSTRLMHHVFKPCYI